MDRFSANDRRRAAAGEQMTAAQLIEQVPISRIWRALGGGEIRRGRGQAFWRNGDGWSVSLDDKRGAWFDHRDGIGGGILDLIQHVRGGSRTESLRWLSDQFGLPLDYTHLSREDRRRYAHARRDAPDLARAAAFWWRARREQLESRKAEATAREDWSELESAAHEHYLLSTLRPDEVVLAYQRAREDDPTGTEELIAGEEDWAQRSEASVIVLIALWAREAGHDK
jgi:hypothetical protein